MIIYRYPEGTSKMEGSLIYNSNYEYTEFFERFIKMDQVKIFQHQFSQIYLVLMEN